MGNANEAESHTDTTRAALVGPTRLNAAAAGAVAAGAALATAELVSAFGEPGQSLVGGVGSGMIERAGGGLVRWAISMFGKNDKVVLAGGIVVTTLAIGTLIGIVSRRKRVASVIGFALLGLAGLLLGRIRDPANQVIVLLASGLGAAAGAVVLLGLLAIAERPSKRIATSFDTPTNAYASRRAFFGWAGGIGAFAAAAAYGGRQLAGRSVADSARAKVSLPAVEGIRPSGPPPGETPEGLTPYLTPNSDFYLIDTALVTPQVDPTNWTLKVSGMVDRPFEMDLAGLLATPMVEETVTMSCVSNEVGGDLVGNARWQGIPLKSLIDRAGVQAGASQIAALSVDGWTAGFPTSTLDDGRPAIVAVGMNGEPLPVEHGFPARLVVAGLYGYVSATKWLSEIRLTTWEGFDGYWTRKGWSKRGPVKIQSRIDVPRSRSEIAPGPTKIAGVAWAPTRGISKVEVQVDDGPWTRARLLDAGFNNTDNTWHQWVAEWDATPGDHTIRARATDRRGETQTAAVSPPEPDGATGYPTRRVAVRD